MHCATVNYVLVQLGIYEYDELGFNCQVQKKLLPNPEELLIGQMDK